MSTNRRTRVSQTSRQRPVHQETSGASKDEDSVGSSANGESADELWEEEEADLRHANAGAQLRMLRGRLQLETPLTYTTVVLPLTRLVVPDEARLSRRGRPFSVNVGLMGMLHPPSITPIPGTDTYRVVTGRRRVIGARLLGEPETLECHCYERLSQKDETLLILSENMRRTPAWTQEVAALAELVDTQVGMTEQELAILFGLSVATIRERLKLALLPPGIRSQVTSGALGQSVARRMTRLTAAARALLEDQAQDGETITEEMVKQAMRGQIGAGMGVVRQALAESWSPWDTATTWREAQQAQQAQAAQSERSGDESAPTRLTNLSGREDMANGAGHSAMEAWDCSAVEHLMQELLQLEPVLAQLPGAARAGMLALALRQELMILQRTMPATQSTQDSEAAISETTLRLARPRRTKRTAVIDTPDDTERSSGTNDVPSIPARSVLEQSPSPDRHLDATMSRLR